MHKNQDSSFMRNIPNLLTISRVILTFIVIYLVFTNASLIGVVIVFVIAALTDFIDGYLARKFNWISEFGRKADMIADRFLWGGTVMTILAVYGLENKLSFIYGLQFFLIMSREIIAAPFALLAFFSGKPIPNAAYIAKLTTFLQGFAVPLLLLSLKYPILVYFSVPLSIAIAITGTLSAFKYINDIKNTDIK